MPLYYRGRVCRLAHVLGTVDGYARLRAIPIGCLLLLLSFSGTAGVAHMEAQNIKADFVSKKYLYHTGKRCSREYAIHIVEAFDQVEDPQLRSVLMAICCVESGYNYKCITTNKKGRSVGMMQIHEGIFHYFFEPDQDAVRVLTDKEIGPDASVGVAKEHFENLGCNIRSYYLGTNGAKKRPRLASGYAKKCWKVLKQMPWTVKNKQGEPGLCYHNYFSKP